MICSNPTKSIKNALPYVKSGSTPTRSNLLFFTESVVWIEFQFFIPDDFIRQAGQFLMPGPI
jgi:hypothetical protein